MRARPSLPLALVALLALGAISLVRAQDAGVAPEALPADAPAALPVATEVPAEAPAADSQAHADAVEDAEPTGPTPEQAALLESTHVTELAQETRTALRDARPLLRADSAVLRIERDLPAREADVTRLTSPARLAQIGRMSQRELADLRQEWRSFREGFEAWQATLAARATELEEARTTLVALRRTWRALRDAAQADPGGSTTRLERITTSLDQVRAAASQLDTRRDAVQALEDRVSELLIACDDVGDDIRDALAAYRQHLFVRDRAPLWQGLGPDVDDGDEPAWTEHLGAQATLLAEQTPATLRLVVLIALLALGIEALRRRSTRWASDTDLTVARAIAEHPIATALVLGLLASRLVVSHAPVLYMDAVAVVMLAPIVWLVRPLAPASLRPFVWIVVAYVVVDRIEGTMNDGSALRRGLVLVESIAAMTTLGTWARRATDATERVTRIARLLALVSAAILGAGLVANVLGYAFLATVLVRGTAFALDGALSLATALLILDALAVVLLGSPLLMRSNGVRAHRALILSRLQGGLVLALGLAWCVLVLGGYGVATPFFAWVDDTLHAHGSFGTLDLTLGEILAASLVLATSWVVTRFVLFVLELDVLPRLPLQAGVDGAIAGLTRYVLFSAGLVLALGTLGIDASQIALVAGALGVGVGFGLQGIVANFIAGLVLMLERPVRLGDRIEVGGLTGAVQRIGLRSSTVRGDDGAEVIVPNETLIGREVVNWTLSDRKQRVQVQFGVAYGTDPDLVLDVVKRAVTAHPDVLGKTAGAAEPLVEFTAFGPSSLDFVVRFWAVEDDHGNRLRSEVGLAVLRALKEAKIEIPFPQQEVRVIGVPPTKAG